ncbi:hypothetical protein [Nocardia sp. R7R-8]|uniref:hypothetical protein n=1 Tax=Nocardia sp. R7R-8 TaxID=3459304 RepID=UPI00403DCA5E
MTANSIVLYQLIAMTHQEAHQPPSVPFTIDQAHLVMQLHVACRARRCPRKAAALDALIEAGRLISDATKPR